MAGGKPNKRVNLREKVGRRLLAMHAPATATTAPAALTHSSSPSAANTGAEEDQVPSSLSSRNPHAKARATPTAATLNASSVSATSARSKVAKRRPGAAAATGAASSSSAASKRQSAKKETKKKTGAGVHPADARRAAVQERRRLLLPAMSAAEVRMAAAQEELQLFDKVQTVPAYAADPFAAVMQHLSATMDTLKPQTADIGRVARDSADERKRRV